MGPLESEAKAVEAAVIFAKNIGIQEVVFESDLMMVYSALQGLTEPPSSIEGYSDTKATSFLSPN